MEPKYKVCYLSERGHKNFWYPTKDSALYSTECEHEALNWVSGAGVKLRAIKIKKTCIVPIDIHVRAVENMSISVPEDNRYIVVWVNENLAP